MFQVNPTLLIHPRTLNGRRQFVAVTDEGRPPVVLRDPRVPWALISLPQRFTADEAVEQWRKQAALIEIADELWRIVVAERMVLTEGEGDGRSRRWRQYHWEEAFLYHEGTRSYPFLQMDSSAAFRADDDRMREYMAESSVPPLYLETRASAAVPLTRHDASQSLDSLVASLSRKDRRGVEGLSLLFDVCFGERRRIRFKIQGEFLGKAVPSGGARHPTEAFYIALPDAPIDAGVYHYNVAHHRLDMISAGDHTAATERATYDLFRRYRETPVGVLVLASVWERAMWRYRDARSARAPFIDAGHVLMAYRTVCGKLGFGYYTSQKVRDADMCGLLSCEPARVTPLYAGILV